MNVTAAAMSVFFMVSVSCLIGNEVRKIGDPEKDHRLQPSEWVVLDQVIFRCNGQAVFLFHPTNSAYEWLTMNS